MRSPRRLIGSLFSLLGALACLHSVANAAESSSAVLDRLIGAAWARAKLQPAALADDAEFVRRIYLDLIGRIPTRDEIVRFYADQDRRKRSKLIDQLLAGGEFASHWRENLNARLMGGPAFAGNPEWRAWLEESLKQNKKWDEMAREILRGRPGKSGTAGASGFLLSRLAQGEAGLDTVTRDVSRILFGVDIQCARCHKHPEVKQWKQEYYWGMAAFFKRSYALHVKGKTFVAERASGEVEYTGKAKERLAAQPMFLTGEKLTEPRPRPAPAAQPKVQSGLATPPMEDPADYLVPPETAKEITRVPVPKFSRRERLIETAINGKEPFFKRAAVNYVWSQLLGRGLVEPIDQMHEANPPSHPDVLEFLADDFVAHQFDLRYLIRSIANSHVYQLSSRYLPSGNRPAEEAFACGLVRPLTAQQLALSLLVAAGCYDSFRTGTDAATRSDPGVLRAKLETRYAATLASLVKELDTGIDPYQPGVREALFEANSTAFAEFLSTGGLAARLASVKDDGDLVEEAFLRVLARLPAPEESGRIRGYFQERIDRRVPACEQIVWALVTSTEFRFNH